MTIHFPRTPEQGSAMLAALFKADPGRSAVFKNIVARLEPDGSFGDRARYYVARCTFRRATLRSVLSSTGQPFPEWTRESRVAAAENEAFVAVYRETYNEFRRDRRRGEGATLDA